MGHDVFLLIPSPFGILLALAGLWAVLWDARQSYLRGYFRDARFSRTYGLIYIVVGLSIWILRRVYA